MAKIATTFEDNQGEQHKTPEAAALADLTIILGRIGAESGLTAGLAKVILDKRPDIERVYGEFDAMRAWQERHA